MKKIFLTLCLLLPLALQAQIPQSKYHYQRASLYELLPAGRNDILFVGNSITNGCEWAEIFGNKHIKNRGINGDRSHDILDMIDVLLKGQPAKIFLMIGVNDLALGISPEIVAGNVTEIADRVRRGSPRTRLFIQSILPVNAKIAGVEGGHFSKNEEIVQTNALVEKMCEDKGIKYIDLWSIMANDQRLLKAEYTNDGLHLLGAGYAAWAREIRSHVK